MPGRSDHPVLSSPFTLLGLLAVGLLLRIVCFVGVSGYDDISYFKHALECIEGTFSTEFESGGEFPFRYRVGIVLPTALLFALFGSSEYVAGILPMLVSLGLIWLSWRLGRMISASTGVIAAALMVTFPLAVVSAGSMLVGPFSAFFCGLSIMLWLEAEGFTLHGSDGSVDEASSSLQNLRYLGCGLSLGIAYLFRIEAGLHALVFAALALSVRRPRIGWVIAGAGAVAVVAAENVYYWSAHGEWLYRLRAVSGGFADIQADLSETILEYKSVWMYVEALFTRPVDLGLHGAAWTIAAVAGLIYWRRPGRMPFLLWFWIILLYLSFGTWSLTTYVPTTKNPRYLMNVALPGIVLLAMCIDELMSRGGKRRAAAVVATSGVILGSLLLLNVTYVYRLENAAGARHAASRIQELTAEGHESETFVWCEHYTAANLRCFLPDHCIRPVSRHELGTGVDQTLVQADDIRSGYVVVDYFLMRKYATYAGMNPPAYLTDPPPGWRVVSDDLRPATGFAYGVLEVVSRMAGNRLSGLQESIRPDRIVIYEVGKDQE